MFPEIQSGTDKNENVIKLAKISDNAFRFWNGGYGDDFGGVQKMTDTARFVLGIIGIIGGILCAIADLLLDIKDPK